MLYFIREDKILELLKKLIGKWEVYAPLVQRGGDVLLERLEDGEGKEGIDRQLERLDVSSRSLIPPKEVFFPQSEVMFSWRGRSSPIDVDERGNDSSKPRLVFGIKPCDYYALKIVDNFFRTNVEDYYYVSKANDSFYVVFACLTPPEPDTCFCSSTGTGPYLDSKRIDFDIQFVKASMGFIVEVASSRGEEFVGDNLEFFERKNSKDLSKELSVLLEEAIDKVSLRVDFEKALRVVEEESQKPLKESRLIPIYREIANRCIYCGACLYACPTCTCFNVYDTTNSSLLSEIESEKFEEAFSQGASEDEFFKERGERLRVWDGCVFSGYTREASGHNPREEAYVRTARRYEHKLRYDIAFHGKSGCVGCGRCLSVCPVDIGMSNFIRDVTSSQLVLDGMDKK